MQHLPHTTVKFDTVSKECEGRSPIFIPIRSVKRDLERRGYVCGYSILGLRRTVRIVGSWISVRRGSKGDEWVGGWGGGMRGWTYDHN
jgi:hypothetical protein